MITLVLQSRLKSVAALEGGNGGEAGVVVREPCHIVGQLVQAGVGDRRRGGRAGVVVGVFCHHVDLLLQVERGGTGIKLYGWPEQFGNGLAEHGLQNAAGVGAQGERIDVSCSPSLRGAFTAGRIVGALANDLGGRGREQGDHLRDTQAAFHAQLLQQGRRLLPHVFVSTSLGSSARI